MVGRQLTSVGLRRSGLGFARSHRWGDHGGAMGSWCALDGSQGALHGRQGGASLQSRYRAEVVLALGLALSGVLHHCTDCAGGLLQVSRNDNQGKQQLG